jgi:concanavalin A-like lectin/glucanase superfamily protein/fibronectin type III domain protein
VPKERLVNGLRLLVVTIALLATSAPAASAATALYPDLRTLPPRDLRFEFTDTDQGKQNVLRFSNTTWNAGQGPLEIGATVPSGATSVPATQTVRYDDGSTAKYNVGDYTIHVQHQHFHYADWGRYELWTKAAYDAWIAAGRPASTQPDIIGTKTTSCVLDEEFIASLPGTPYPRVYPDAGCDPTWNGTIKSGLSVGWGDTYDYYRYDQWIPLGANKLADGTYVLRSIADPNNKVYESANKSDTSRESQASNEATVIVKVVGGAIQDQDRPSGTVTINDVDAKTGSTNVTVRVLGRDDVSGVTQARISNDGVTWRQYPYGGSGSSPMSVSWDLADTRYGGSTTGGVRTVYAQFQDASGKWSATETDTIELTTGTTPPGGGGSNSLYRTAVMGDGPLGYWRLDETSGTTALDQIGLLNGTYKGVTLGAASLLNSDLDKAATFNGAGDVATANASSLAFSGPFSLEAWIKPTSIPAAGSWASVVTKPEAYSLQFNGPLMEFTVIQNGVRRRLQAPAGAIVAGQTYHVVGTYDGAQQRLYINGQLVSSAALTGAASQGTAGLHIGSWDGTREFFRGTIDEVAVWNKLLTGLQAKQHYDAGVSTAVGVATPTSLTATAISSSAVNVTWLDNSANETGFVLERSATSTFTSPTQISLGQNVTSYSDTGRAAGTTYYYRVKAITATDSSGWSNTASATTTAATPTAPAAPSGLSANATSDTQVDLAWTDNATNETGYTLERSATSTFASPTAISLPAGTTSYADTGRTASTTYWYRVRAVNGTATSAYSNTASATTQPTPATAPAAPSALTATAASPSAINLAWADNATNETGYVVERSADSAFSAPTAASLPAGATSYQSTGLAAATTYWFRVRAVNGSLSSAWSNSANATTQSASTGSYLTAVTADAPVSHWRLGETSGTAAADARGANPGTYRNGTLLGQASLVATDTANRAVRVDGSNDDVSVPDSASLDLTTGITLEAWIRPDAIPAAGGWASVITKAESYSLQFNGPMLELTVIQNGTRRRLDAPSGAIVAGRTYHVVATYDGATQRMFINGAEVASRAQTGGATITTWPLTIGSWNGGGEYFRGTVDEVAVYNKALTAARVQAHYQAGGPVATTSGATTFAARTSRRKVKRSSFLSAAQRRTFARKGPGAKRSRPLPSRRRYKRS